MAARSPSTGHLRKKQFQPSISAYFNTRDATTTTAMRQSQTISPLSPPLPAETQASLLNVGMRVRKSVPEGYKTHKTLGQPGFPFPSTAPVAPTRISRSSGSSTNTKELTPFCGLHKTGGWAAQAVPPSSAPAVMERYYEDDDEVPSVTMSQSTLASIQSSSTSFAPQPEHRRKRTYEEEIEDDLDSFFDDGEESGVLDDQPLWTERPIAKMKVPVQKAGANRRVRILGDDDFEDANFLAPPEHGMDIDEEF